MNKLLITGSNGYVGRQLVDRLMRSGYDVTATSRSVNSLKNDPSINYFSLDLTDRDRTLALIKGFDVVIHCAAQTRGEDARSMKSSNVSSTQNLVESCSKNRIARLIFLSTDLAYDPNGVYAETKLTAEKIIRESGINSLIIRMGTVLGNYDPQANSSLSKLIEFVSKAPFIPLINGGAMEINITAVPDLLDLVENALKNPTLYPDKSIVAVFSARMKLHQIIDCVEQGLKTHKTRLNIPLRAFSPLLKITRHLPFLRGISNRLLQMSLDRPLLHQPSHYLKNQTATRTLLAQMAERGKFLSSL